MLATASLSYLVGDKQYVWQGPSTLNTSPSDWFVCVYQLVFDLIFTFIDLGYLILININKVQI